MKIIIQYELHKIKKVHLQNLKHLHPGLTALGNKSFTSLSWRLHRSQCGRGVGRFADTEEEAYRVWFWYLCRGGRVWPNHGNRKLADNGNVGFGKEI